MAESPSTKSPPNNVAVFKVKPKTIRATHRRYEIIIRFQPKDKRWHWEIHYQPPKRVLRGDNATQTIALRKAKETIDSIIDGE